jgi:hypothetical protein
MQSEQIVVAGPNLLDQTEVEHLREVIVSAVAADE